MTETHRPLPNRLVAAYSFPALVSSTIGIPLTIYLGPFYAEDVGLSLAVIGTIFMLMRMWDMVSDPLVGILSDRFSLPLGKRRPWLLLGAPLLMASIYATFMPPANAGVGYFVVWLIVLYTGWTLITINHLAWAAELTKDYHERSKLLGWREFAGLVGTVMLLAIPMILAQLGVTGYTPALAAMAVFLLIATPIAILTPVVLIREQAAATAPRSGAREFLQTLIKDRPLQRLMLLDLLLTTGGGTVAGASLFFIDHVLNLKQYAGLAIFAQYVISLLSVPVWIRIAYALGKHRTLALSLLIFPSGLLLATVIPSGSLLWFAPVVLMKGVGFGAIWFAVRAIIADLVDADELRTGSARTATYYSFVTTTQKLGFAIAVGVSYPLLQFLGFEAGSVIDDNGVFALRMVYSIVPSLLFAICVVLVWNFPIGEHEQREIREQIDRRNLDVA